MPPGISAMAARYKVRTVVTDETTVTFREAPANVAPPIKSLFYGGESNGYEFLYGRGEPNMT